ncbi:GntR family transcriptional regulator [Streptomyces sp. NPDC059575]|uniref:GntR family transcriptional regulator n=1 Tax=Streptomyces sp. NPDC059575 TaxID=3346872 RepID=UPI0036CFBDAB
MTSEFGSTYKNLRCGLAQLAQLETEFRDPAGTTAERRSAQDLVELWLPLAEDRLREAADSPSDQARWREAIQAVAPPKESEAEESATELSFMTFLSGARVLLHCLLDAERPGPQVGAIADRVRKFIKDGEYPAGAWLSVGRITTESGCLAASVERVHLALRDLEAEGLVTFSPSSGRARVAGEAIKPDRPAQIAGWLRVLIRAGVYPPYSELPTSQPLARGLVAKVQDVSAALHVLASEEILNCRRGRRPLVKPWLPIDVAPPPEIADLAQELRGLATGDVDLSSSNVRMTCHRARVWWHSRLTPAPDQLENTFRTLVGAALDLFEFFLETRDASQDVDTDTLLRRTGVTALAKMPDDVQERVWRTACLAVAVLEVREAATALARRREFMRRALAQSEAAAGPAPCPSETPTNEVD